MFDSPVFESFAHYASGMATMSFGMWALTLYKWRKRNRMIFLLFLAVAYITLGFVKDIVFLLPSQLFPDYGYMENMVSIFDMAFVPLVCAFFLEATRPGLVTNARLLLAFLVFIAFLPLYCVLHAQWVVNGSFMLSMLAAILTLVLVLLNVARYNKYLSANYSYTKNIGVGWCVGCAFGFFLWLFVYQVSFYEPTWFSEMVYDVGLVIIWNIVCVLARRHRVVVDMMAFEDEVEPQPREVPQPLPETGAEMPLPTMPAAVASVSHTKYLSVAEALLRCMETDKLYLNPRLSLADLAVATNSNKTYVSNYINMLGKTFYDYVNEYRVAEACRIIDERSAGERLSMSDVAAQSGFNSVSTFNRYFVKIKGATPGSYLRR